MSNLFFTDAERRERDAVRNKGAERVRYSAPWFVASGRPLYVFGAGNVTRTVTLPLLAGANILGLVDNNPALHGSEMSGLPVFNPDEARRRDREAIVLISVLDETAFGDILAQCAAMGWETTNWQTCIMLSDARRYVEDLETLPGAERGLAIWSDEESREVYRSRVRFQSAFDPAFLPPKAPGDTYFQPFIPKQAYRDFVDLGAYTGDTLGVFLQHAGNVYDNYYAFEPMPKFLPELRAMADGDRRIHIIEAAVSDKPSVARIKSDAGCPHLSGDGDLAVRVAALNQELSGKRVSCIKADIEGAEAGALRGAEGIIREQKPVLAISAYHGPEAVWEIPLQIHDMNLGYKLLLRHHFKYLDCDTICYALP